MATYVMTACKLYVGEFDLSGDVNSLTLSADTDAVEDTTFSSGGVRTFRPGLSDVSFDHSGFWNATATGDGSDDALFADIGSAPQVITVGATDGLIGNPAFTHQGIEATYSPGGSVGEMFAFTVSGSGSGQFVSGTVLHDASAAVTTSATDTGSQLGAVTSSETVYASLHVVAASGSSPTLDVVVQSDTSGFPSPTSRITFAQAGAVTSEWGSLAGAVTDDYWRVDYTIGGGSPSFTFVVTVGIK